MSAEPPAGGGTRTRPSQQTTRDGVPDSLLLAHLSRDIHRRCTRLDAAYQTRMRAISRSRAEQSAVLDQLLGNLRRVLPALVEPLSLLEVNSATRVGLLHLRGTLLLGERPPFGDDSAERDARREGMFLLDDGGLLRARFTGWCRYVDLPRPLWEVDRLERLEARHLLREHALTEVVDGMVRRLIEATRRYRLERRTLQNELHRLRLVQDLLQNGLLAGATHAGASVRA